MQFIPPSSTRGLQNNNKKKPTMAMMGSRRMVMIAFVPLALVVLTVVEIFWETLELELTTGVAKPDEINAPRQRPSMILHVGPPKTGTSTIQGAFTRYHSDLARLDNVYFMGAPDRDPKEDDLYEMYKMKDFVWTTKREFVRDMLAHQKESHNIVISSEHYTTTNVIKNSDRLLDYIFLRDKGRVAKAYVGHDAEEEADEDGGDNKEDGVGDCSYEDELPSWTNATLDEYSRFGFDVSIVVTYRHYFQWIPSFYYQFFSTYLIKSQHSRIYVIERALEKLGARYLSEESLLEDWPVDEIEKWPNTIESHGPLFSYRRWSALPSLRHRMRLFDMHQQRITHGNTSDNSSNTTTKRDIFRDFLCGDILKAPRTCTILANRTPKVERVRKTYFGGILETGKLSDTDKLQLMKNAMERLPIPRFREKKVKQPLVDFADRLPDPSKSIFKKTRVSIHNTFARWAAKERTRRHQNSNHTGEDSEGGHWEMCLGATSLRNLKVASWNILRHLEALGRTQTRNRRKVVSHDLDGGDTDPLLLSPRSILAADNDDAVESSQSKSKWEPIKMAHDALFDRTVLSRAYCELDMDRLFADENFVREVFYTKR